MVWNHYNIQYFTIFVDVYQILEEKIIDKFLNEFLYNINIFGFLGPFFAV